MKHFQIFGAALSIFLFTVVPFRGHAENLEDLSKTVDQIHHELTETITRNCVTVHRNPWRDTDVIYEDYGDGYDQHRCEEGKRVLSSVHSLAKAMRSPFIETSSIHRKVVLLQRASEDILKSEILLCQEKAMHSLTDVDTGFEKAEEELMGVCPHLKGIAAFCHAQAEGMRGDALLERVSFDNRSQK